jgi:HEAT repeat protein
VRTPPILIAHAEGEEALAADIAGPLEDLGYSVAHQGTMLVGQSLINEMSKLLATGSPVVVCGTVRAVGTPWARRLVSAARRHADSRVFAVQVEEQADLDQLAFDDVIARYWQDPDLAMRQLAEALERFFPTDLEGRPLAADAENRYRAVALNAWDIIDLANLPELDRHLATRRIDLRSLYVPLRVLSTAALPPVDPRATASRGVKSSVVEDHEPETREVPVGERLAEIPLLVVLGDPGAGKTTMLRWLSTAYLLRLQHDPAADEMPGAHTLPRRDWLPILIRCRDLDEPLLSGTLEDVLRSTLRRYQLTATTAGAVLPLLLERLGSGQAMLLIDGLDEITETTARARFCEHLERMHGAYPLAPIVVTSRTAAYREMGRRLAEFEHVTVADLSWSDKRQFAQRWIDVTEPIPAHRAEAAQALVDDMQSSPGIERLTDNPMLLTTLALVKRRVGKLPSRRADLYSEAVQVLLNWRSEVEAPLDQREAVPQLEYIAYAMCDLGVQQLREDEIIDLLHRMREEYPRLRNRLRHEPEQFVPLLERRTGILVEAGRIRHAGQTMAIYEFRHLTFQEYLAGTSLVSGRFPGRQRGMSLAEQVGMLAARAAEVEDDDDLEDGVADVDGDGHWEEAIRLCMLTCHDDDAEDVMRAVLGHRVDGTYSEPRATLAALCLADEPDVTDETATLVLDAYLECLSAAAASPAYAYVAPMADLVSSRYRAELTTTLLRHIEADADAWGFDAYESLREALSDQASGQVSDEASLLTQIMSDDERVVVDAALDLAVHDTPQVGAPACEQIAALEAATEGASGPVAVSLIWALQKLGADGPGFDVSPERAHHMLRMLAHSSPVARWSAAEALRFAPGEGVTPALVQVLEDPCWVVRHVAAQSLGGREDSGALPGLIDGLHDEHPEVRMACVEGLRLATDVSAVETLAATLGDPDEDVRKHVIDALGAIGDQRIVDDLRRYLRDSHVHVRMAAAAALGDLSNPRALPDLVAAIVDRHPSVRASVVQALGKLEDPRTLDPLLDVAGDDSSMVRQRAMTALRQFASPRVTATLVGALDDADDDVRRSAMGSLAYQQFEHAIALLPHAAEAAVGDDLVNLLVTTEEPGVRDHLLDLLTTGTIEERRIAARTAGRAGWLSATRNLVSLLHHPDQDCRSAAQQALSELGSTAAFSTFLPLLQRNDDPSYDAAVALGSLGDRAAVAPLVAAITSEGETRQEVIEALGLLGDTAVVDILLAALDDPSRFVRLAVALALARMREPAAAEPLVGVLADGLDDDEKIDARDAFVAIGPAAIPALRDGLHHAAWTTRLQCATALHSLNDPAGVPILAAALRNRSWSVRRDAATALSDLHHPPALPHLLDALGDADYQVRATAALGAASLNGDAILPALTGLVDDSDWFVRRVAAEALSAHRDPAAVPALLSAVEDPQLGPRAAAADALGRLGDPVAIDPLVALTTDPVFTVRYAALEALGELEPTAAAHDAVHTALHDEHWGLRMTAARVLGVWADPSALPHLLTALEDDAEQVSRVAISVLGRIGSAAVLPRLRLRLKDPNWEIRLNATVAIGRIAPESVAIDDLGRVVSAQECLLCATVSPQGSVRAWVELADKLGLSSSEDLALAASLIQAVGTEDLADRLYRRALAADRLATTVAMYGDFLGRIGDLSAARQHLEEARATAPGHPNVLDYWLHFMSAHDEMPLHHEFARRWTMTPGRPEAVLPYANMARRAGSDMLAQRCIGFVLEEDPDGRMGSFATVTAFLLASGRRERGLRLLRTRSVADRSPDALIAFLRYAHLPDDYPTAPAVDPSTPLFGPLTRWAIEANLIAATDHGHPEPQGLRACAVRLLGPSGLGEMM